MPKISQLPPEENPTPDDEFVMVDKALGITKKVTGDNISGAFGDESIGIEKIKNLSTSINEDGTLKGEWLSWTPTWGGFSSNPSGIFVYTVIGKTVFINMRITSSGTSNANTFTFTLPIAPTSMRGSSQQYAVALNFTEGHAAGASNYGSNISISGSSIIATVNANNSPTSWNTSGSKRFATAQFFYEID